MARKDVEKDSERPHYYSQFWLDVAAGRRIIGTPKNPEDGEAGEAELAEPATSRKTGQIEETGYAESPLATDRKAEHITHPIAEPISTPADFIDPDTNDLEAVLAADEAFQDAPLEDIDVPDMDLSPVDLEEEDELLDEDEEEIEADEDEEEEDDDVNWGRGRKKAKPTRAVKPVVKKPGKRDTRRSF